MNEFEFGIEDDGQGLVLGEQAPPNAEPKWYRDRMDKVSTQMQSMADELKALRAKDVRAELSKKFEAAGVNPAAAGLYQGDPAGVDDWLKANGGLLAKLPGAETAPEGEEGQQPAGPPASTVTPEGQAQMAALQAAGASGAAPPEGSDKEQAAAIAALDTEEKYAAYMRAAGNRFF